MSSRPVSRWLLPGLLAAAVLAMAAWFVSNTEWVQTEVQRSPTGKAAEDEHYALRRVLEQLGTRVEVREGLVEPPPPNAVLLLESWVWNVLPTQDRGLRDWVERGGQLVLGSWAIPPSTPKAWILPPDEESAGRWIPIQSQARHPSPTRRTPAARPSTSDPGVLRDLVPARMRDCEAAIEPGGVAPAFAEEAASENPNERAYMLCAIGGSLKSIRTRPLWALAIGDDAQVLRVPVGSGSVTVVSEAGLFSNRLLLKGDDALIAVAALQAHPGTLVWIASASNRRGLLAWLWRRASPALLLGAAALALWLWRDGTRFGPLEAAAQPVRRSMIEQISGTAAFLWQRDPRALHRAQLRALDETAQRRLRHYSKLDRPDRALAIARASGLDAAALLQACSFGDAASARALPRALAVLEAARRALLERGAAVRSDAHATAETVPQPGNKNQGA